MKFKFVLAAFFIFIFKDLFSFNNQIGFFVMIFSFLFMLYLMSGSRNLISAKHKIAIILYLFISFTTLLLLSLIHEVEYFTYLSFFRTTIGGFIFIILILSSRDLLTLSQFRRILVFVLLSQVLFGALQLFGFFSIESSIEGLNYFRGSFSNNNLLGNFLCVLGLILINEIFVQRYLAINKYICFLLAFLCVFSIFLTGIRTSLASFIVGLVMLSLYRKNLFSFIKSYILITVVLFLSFFYLNTSDSFVRNMEGFTNLFSAGSLENSGTTVALSARLYSLVDLETFIFGKGKLFYGGYSVVDSGSTLKEISIENKNISDSLVLLLFVEFGFFGFILFFVPLISIYFFPLRYDKTIISIFVFVLVLQTITDLGIFFTPSLILFLLYIKVQSLESYPHYPPATGALGRV